MMPFERAQRLALLHARSLGLTSPLVADPVGQRGSGWWVIEVRDPNPANFNPDIPAFVVVDSGAVETYQLPTGSRFEGLRTVESGSVIDLDTALHEA